MRNVTCKPDYSRKTKLTLKGGKEMQQTVVPAGALTILGALIAILGLFGGGIGWTALGLTAIATAGLIGLLSERTRRA